MFAMSAFGSSFLISEWLTWGRITDQLLRGRQMTGGYS